jgi:hypothetical protein
VVGLIAYAAVAAFYSLFDLLAARGTFYTVNILGRVVFRGVRDAAVLQAPAPIDGGAVFAYDGVHLVLSLLIGVVVVQLASTGERNSALARPMVLVIVGGFVLTIFAMAVLSTPIRPLLPLWSIVLANSLAVVLAGAWLVSRRPGLVGRLFSGSSRSVAQV